MDTAFSIKDAAGMLEALDAAKGRYHYRQYRKILRQDGGEGSGNFGHRGIPEHQGGSRPNPNASENRIETSNGEYTSRAQITEAVREGVSRAAEAEGRRQIEYAREVVERARNSDPDEPDTEREAPPGRDRPEETTETEEETTEETSEVTEETRGPDQDPPQRQRPNLFEHYQYSELNEDPLANLRRNRQFSDYEYSEEREQDPASRLTGRRGNPMFEDYQYSEESELDPVTRMQRQRERERTQSEYQYSEENEDPAGRLTGNTEQARQAQMERIQTIRKQIDQLDKALESLTKSYADTEKIRQARGLRKVWLIVKRAINGLVRDPEVTMSMALLKYGTGRELPPNETVNRARALIGMAQRRAVESGGSEQPSQALRQILNTITDSADSPSEETDEVAAMTALTLKQLKGNRLRFIQTWLGPEQKLDRADIVLSIGADSGTDWFVQYARDGDGLVQTTGCIPGQRYRPTEDRNSKVLRKWPGLQSTEGGR